MFSPVTSPLAAGGYGDVAGGYGNTGAGAGAGAGAGVVTVTLRNFKFSGFNRSAITVPYQTAATFQGFLYFVMNNFPPTVTKYLQQQRVEFMSLNGMPLTPTNWEYTVKPGTQILMRKVEFGALGYSMAPYMNNMSGYSSGAGAMGAGAMGAGGVGPVPRSMAGTGGYGLGGGYGPGAMSGPGTMGGTGVAGNYGGYGPGSYGAAGAPRRGTFSNWLLS